MTTRWMMVAIGGLAACGATSAPATPAPIAPEILAAIGAGEPAVDHAGQPLVWTLVAESKVMSDIKVYRAWDVYPICAVWDGHQKQRITAPTDAASFDALADRTGVVVRTAADAADLVTLYEYLTTCPYVPQGLQIKASTDTRVELTYERTVPWSPPTKGAEIAGARTMIETVRVQIVDHRHVRIESERSVVKSESP